MSREIPYCFIESSLSIYHSCLIFSFLDGIFVSFEFPVLLISAWPAYRLDDTCSIGELLRVPIDTFEERMDEMLFRWFSFTSELRLCFIVCFSSPVDDRTFSSYRRQSSRMDKCIKIRKVALGFRCEVSRGDSRLEFSCILSIEMTISTYHELYGCHDFFRTSITIVSDMDTFQSSFRSRKVCDLIFIFFYDLFTAIYDISVELGFDPIRKMEEFCRSHGESCRVEF